MKKPILILTWLGLFISSLLYVFTSDSGNPNTERALATTAVGDKADYWLVENRDAAIFIYGMDENGTLSSVYRQYGKKLVVHSGAVAITDTKDNIWVARGYYYNEEQNPRRWDVFYVDKYTGNSTVLDGSSEYMDLFITDIVVEDELVYISGIDPSGNALTIVSSGTNSQTNWELEAMIPTSHGVSACYRQGSLLVLCQDGTMIRDGVSGIVTEHLYPTVVHPEPSAVSWKVLLVCKSLGMLEMTVFVLFVTIAFVVIYSSKNWKSVTMRVSALAVLFLILMICVTLRCVFLSTDRLVESSAHITATHIGENKVVALEKEEIVDILSHSFYQKESSEGILALLQPGDTLYGISGKDIWVVASDRFAKGNDDTLHSAVEEIFAEAMKGYSGSVVFYDNGRMNAVHVKPVEVQGVQVGILLSQYPQINEKVMMWDALNEMYVLMLLVVVTTLVVLLWMLGKFHQSMKGLTEQMHCISAGDLTTRTALDRADEIGEISNTMQEMCMGLSIRNYEIQLAMTAYNRFIPLGLCQLLDRGNILEVALGDMESITGSVGIFAVNNKEIVRSRFEDDEYIKFVNNWYEELEKNTKKHDGQMLYSGFEISNMPVFYPISAVDAVEAGLEMIGNIGVDIWKQNVNPDVFFMLHHMTYHYGVGGTEEQSFPFMSSVEGEFLATLASKFKSTGVHMVMTEEFMKRLDMVCTTRYIGFVNSEDGSQSYKLYEVLDSYSVVERNVRLSYNHRLQEAIGLFSRNDFYLARNILSAILKTCPEDGIARFYLFACEYYFHADTDKVDYQLFGIDGGVVH